MRIKLQEPSSHCRNTSGQEQGQDIIEFALVAPVVILLIFGIMQLGLLVMQYNTVSNAAREGARYGVVDPPGSADSATCDAAAGNPNSVLAAACAITVGLPASQVTVSWTLAQSVVSSVGSISVSVAYPAPVIIEPVLRAMGGSGTINLAATSSMQREQ